MNTFTDDNFIVLRTSQDGIFKVTISTENKEVIFSEIMSSQDRQIALKGFSLSEHTVVISPIKSHV